MEHIHVVSTLLFCDSEKIDTLCEAAVEPVVEDLTFPEPGILHQFSSNIYAGSLEIEGWELVYETRELCTAQVFFSNQKWQLLLVFKGTSNLQDVVADLRNVWWNNLKGAPDAAFTVGEEVRKLANKFKRRPQIIITGHSLGGFLAQIAAYTIANLYVENGEVLKVARPHWGVHPHVVVFDSPSCFNTITRISGENPRTVASVWMDVTNFMIERNVVNRSWYQGVHIGLLIRVKTSENLRSMNGWNLFHAHELKFFSKVDLSSAESVIDITKNVKRPFDATEVPCFAFSMDEWDLLKTAKCLLHDEVTNNLPGFSFDFHTIRLVEVDAEFVLKARRFVAQNRKKLNPHAIYLKQLKRGLDFEIHASSPCQEKYFLDEHILEEVASWPNGSCVSLPVVEDRLLFASLLCNSSADFLCVKLSQWSDLQEQHKLLDHLSATTIMFLVHDEDQVQCNQQLAGRARPKVLFLGSSAECSQSVRFECPLTPTILDLSSRHQLGVQEFNYLGNMVQASEVFSDGLFKNVPIARFKDFEIIVPIKSRPCLEPTLRSLNQTFDVARFAEHVDQGEGSHVITSGSGTGKSWTLRRLRQELQARSPDWWVLALDIADMRSRLDAVCGWNFEEVIRPVNLDALQSQVFHRKLVANKVICLIDSSENLDFYTENFLKLANERNVKVIIAARELRNVPLSYNMSRLEELDDFEQATFLSKCCQLREINIASRFLERLRNRGAADYRGTVLHLRVLALMCPNGHFQDTIDTFHRHFPCMPALFQI